jgi:hypothetical protein
LGLTGGSANTGNSRLVGNSEVSLDRFLAEVG